VHCKKLRRKLEVFVHKINHKEESKVGKLLQSEAEFNGNFGTQDPEDGNEETFDFDAFEEGLEMSEIRELQDPRAKEWIANHDKQLASSLLMSLQHCPPRVCSTTDGPHLERSAVASI
jgi:hypothetical protein